MSRRWSIMDERTIVDSHEASDSVNPKKLDLGGTKESRTKEQPLCWCVGVGVISYLKMKNTETAQINNPMKYASAKQRYASPSIRALSRESWFRSQHKIFSIPGFRDNLVIIILSRWVHIFFFTIVDFTHKWRQTLPHCCTNFGTCGSGIYWIIQDVRSPRRGTKLSILHSSLFVIRCPQEWQTREHGKVALGLVVSEPQMGFQNCSNCYITYIVLLIFLRTKDNIYNKAKVIQQEQ